MVDIRVVSLCHTGPDRHSQWNHTVFKKKTTLLIKTQPLCINNCCISTKHCCFVEMDVLVDHCAPLFCKNGPVCERLPDLWSRSGPWRIALNRRTRISLFAFWVPKMPRRPHGALHHQTSKVPHQPPAQLWYVVVSQIMRLSWLAVCLSGRKMFPFVFASGECLGICCYLNAVFAHGRVQRWCGGSSTQRHEVICRVTPISLTVWRGMEERLRRRRVGGGVTLLPRFVLSAGKPSQPEPLTALGQHLWLAGRPRSKTGLEMSWFLMENRVSAVLHSGMDFFLFASTVSCFKGRLSEFYFNIFSSTFS